MADTKSSLVNTINNLISMTAGRHHEELMTHCDKEFQNIKTLLTKISARLEVLDNATSGTGKRAPRGERKTAAKVAGNESPADQLDNKLKKIINGMHYFRHNFITNEEFRDKYRCECKPLEENVKAKIDKINDVDKCLAAESTQIWRKGLTEIQKTDLKNEFRDWKEKKAKKVDAADVVEVDE